jgi:oligoribonuclease (3'-5' exoribonuclease)
LTNSHLVSAKYRKKKQAQGPGLILGGLKSNKLMQKLDEHGLEYLQDWCSDEVADSCGGSSNCWNGYSYGLV